MVEQLGESTQMRSFAYNHPITNLFVEGLESTDGENAHDSHDKKSWQNELHQRS